MTDLVTDNDFDEDLKMKILKDELVKKFSEYKKTIGYMSADAPIQILCLPSEIEKILLNSGFHRVYDLFDANFVEVKGLGKARIARLTTCLNQFLSMF
jgi:hypothetical protein